MSYSEKYRYTLDDFNFLMHILHGYIVPEDNPALYNRKYGNEEIKKEMGYILQNAIYEYDSNDISISLFPDDYIMIELLFELAFYNNDINDLSKILEVPPVIDENANFQTMAFLDDIDYAEIVFNKTLEEKNKEIDEYNKTVDIVKQYLDVHGDTPMKKITENTGVAYPLVREIVNNGLLKKENISYGEFKELLAH